MNKCKICERPIVSSCGNKNSTILVIGAEPTMDDMEIGYPFRGEYGMILRTEFAKIGWDVLDFHLTTLWLHPIPKKPSAEEVEFHAQECIRTAIGKKAILLLGTVTTKFFLKKSATEVSGLPMTSDLLSAELVMATRSPLDIISGSHGEFILGIKKFIEELKRRKLYA